MPHGIPNTIQLQNDHTKKVDSAALVINTFTQAVDTYKSNSGNIAMYIFCGILCPYLH